MDRELVLAVLIATLCGGALTASGCWPIALPHRSAESALEPQAWRRLWRPLLPAALILAALGGWALNEPADAERVPDYLLWIALPFTVIFARALWRALHALKNPAADQAAATVGLLKPRIFISEQITATLDPDALAAAVAHEQAHARHRDPLRLWLAQIGTDLLWPWPAAQSRMVCWKQALELARDDEARHDGAAGPDLAAAILTVLRVSGASAPSAAATLGGEEAFLKQRVARLLQPLAADSTRPPRNALWLPIAVLLGITLASLAGTVFGEGAVRVLFGMN
jgi:hypothetical protein